MSISRNIDAEVFEVDTMKSKYTHTHTQWLSNDHVMCRNV